MATTDVRWSADSDLIIVGLYGLLPAAVLYFINALFLHVASPRGVPFIRETPGNTCFSWRTRLAYLMYCEFISREAYQNYTKQGQAVQPESVLSIAEAHVEFDQADYSLGHSKYSRDAWQGLLVKTKLNAILENIMLALYDDLSVAFETYFGTDEQNWRSRNEQYLRDCFDAIDGCVIDARVTGSMPPILRPILGPLVGLKARLANRRVRQHFEPLYRERLEILKLAKDDPSHTEPQDLSQMMLRFAQRERPHELNDLTNMDTRLTVANFASMHQTSFQVGVLLNIVASDAEFNTIALLREEVAQVLGNNPNQWTKAKVSRMLKADSAARETLRCHLFVGRAMFRKVVAAERFESDTGNKLPKGSVLSFLSQPAHVDQDTYENPHNYDPSRFSRVRGAAADAGADSAIANALSFVSTGPDYLAFSYGKHACSGGFLVGFELKIIIAYVLTHYDIRLPEEYGGQRPANLWMAEAVVPPRGVNLLGQRRRLKD
ncbi:cytochrome P450 [Aspergillus germanicus]